MVEAKWGDPITIPTDVLSALPQGALISALVTQLLKLLPNRDKNLTGYIHVTSPRGPGVTVRLEQRNGETIDSVTLWADESAIPLPRPAAPAAPTHPPIAPPTATPAPDPAIVSYPLAFPCAVWGLYNLSPTAADLGTNEWRSYLAFAQGEFEQRAGRFEGAMTAYLKALNLDNNNLPAEFNLGVVLAHTGYELPE